LLWVKPVQTRINPLTKTRLYEGDAKAWALFPFFFGSLQSFSFGFVAPFETTSSLIEVFF
jgi:hypothetical protein